MGPEYRAGICVAYSAPDVLSGNLFVLRISLWVQHVREQYRQIDHHFVTTDRYIDISYDVYKLIYRA
jgi:hypothetical protein